MLFPFKYINHTVENLHSYIEHTILEVCCKPDGDFHVGKLHPDFIDIVEEVSKNEKDYLKKPIETIYNICLKLSKQNLQKLRDAFTINNAIEQLCKGEVKPILYKEITKIDEILSKELSQWGADLYNHVLGLSSFHSRNGQLMDYYKEFMRANAKGICPFCGLHDLKSDLLSKKEAYDHFFPKGKYPFNTVNFRNLVPACNTCNSSYKGVKDPIKNGTKRAYYPLSSQNLNINITVKITSIDFDNPKKNIVNLSITSIQQEEEEISTWKELYGIEERYNDKCCSDDSNHWIEHSRQYENYGYNLKEHLHNEIQNRKKFPFKDTNFLRVPFLEECMLIGVFG
jgi:5-methylcytosine-specific restriction endonuclease McrA